MLAVGGYAVKACNSVVDPLVSAPETEVDTNLELEAFNDGWAEIQEGAQFDQDRARFGNESVNITPSKLKNFAIAVSEVDQSAHFDNPQS